MTTAKEYYMDLIDTAIKCAIHSGLSEVDMNRHLSKTTSNLYDEFQAACGTTRTVAKFETAQGRKRKGDGISKDDDGKKRGPDPGEDVDSTILTEELSAETPFIAVEDGEFARVAMKSVSPVTPKRRRCKRPRAASSRSSRFHRQSSDEDYED